MLFHKTCLVCIGAAALTAAPGASAADAVADYSTAANPNAPWAYGFRNAIAAPFNLYTSGFFTGAVHFWDAVFVGTPWVSKETAGAFATIGTTEWQANDVVMHPGVNAQLSVIRFTAPSPGVYSYSIQYDAADNFAGSRDVYVLINGAVAHSGAVLGPIGTATPVTFTGSTPLAVGGTIEYAVGFGGDNDRNDATVIRRAVIKKKLAVARRCRRIQPWTKPWASHESVVQNCNGSGVSFAPVAMDDFVCDVGTRFNHLTWWGTNPTQNGVPQRVFLIRMWIDQNCKPIDFVYSACVVAKYRPVGLDCEGLRVFQYRAKLPTPFLAAAGQRYWLQISEVDNDPNSPLPGVASSPNPGKVDFKWSSHRKIRDCSALQFDMFFGGVKQPLLDPCDLVEEDLAFVLRSRVITGVISPVPITPTVYRFELRRHTDLALMDVQSVEIEPGDGLFEVDSFFDVFTEISATGVCDCVMDIHGMASPGVRIPNPIGPNDVTDLGTIQIPVGDADNSGEVNFGDITKVVAQWLSIGPPLPPTP